MSEANKEEERQRLKRKRHLADDDEEESLRKRLKVDLMRQQQENMKILEKMREDFEKRQEFLMKVSR
jgi:hypothetical protein